MTLDLEEHLRLERAISSRELVLIAVRDFDEKWYAALAGRAIAERDLGHDRSASALEALCADWRNLVDLLETVDVEQAS